MAAYCFLKFPRRREYRSKEIPYRDDSSTLSLKLLKSFDIIVGRRRVAASHGAFFLYRHHEK